MNELDKIYSQYDTETVEANKKLPKPCYGNHNGYYCNYDCQSREGCYEVTMQNWGVCDCKFRPSCHIPRQQAQEYFKKDDPNHICSFKKYFEEESYIEVTIPSGIMKMQPIKEIGVKLNDRNKRK